MGTELYFLLFRRLSVDFKTEFFIFSDEAYPSTIIGKIFHFTNS